MSSINWQTGFVQFGKGSTVICFENNGKIWVDAFEGIIEPGWEEELEPYVGRGYRVATKEEINKWLGGVGGHIPEAGTR